MNDLNKCERACVLALDNVRLRAGRQSTVDELADLTGYEPHEVALALKSLVRRKLVEFRPDSPLTDAERKLIYDA